jgi:hypothetical protein
MRFTLRPATSSDADAITNVHWASFRLLTFLPMLHTIEENRRFITNVILKECEVTVAEDETGIVAFIALGGEEVRLEKCSGGGTGVPGLDPRGRASAPS